MEQLLNEGCHNEENITNLTTNESVRNSMANIRKPRGGWKGDYVSTMGKQKSQGFILTLKHLPENCQEIDFAEWDLNFLK